MAFTFKLLIIPVNYAWVDAKIATHRQSAHNVKADSIYSQTLVLHAPTFPWAVLFVLLLHVSIVKQGTIYSLELAIFAPNLSRHAFFAQIPRIAFNAKLECFLTPPISASRVQLKAVRFATTQLLPNAFLATHTTS